MRSGRILYPTLLIAIALVSALALGEPNRAIASSAPIAAFTWTPCETCLVVGYLFFFSASSSSGSASITTYNWNWGDGTTTTTTSPSTRNDYPAGIPSQGINVTLTVQDSTGQQGTVEQLIMFQTVPSFTIQPQSPDVGQLVTFNATDSKSYSTSNPIQGYQWNFGDDTTGSGVLATHSYSMPGTYRASLSLLTPAGKPTTSETLIVSGQPSLILQTTFHGLSITATGTFSISATNKTIAGSVSVSIVNATTGAPIFSKTYNINATFNSMGRAVFVLAAPTSIATLGVSCTADTQAATTCMASRNPDLNADRKVDIIDLATVALAFGSTSGSQGWNPAADLDMNGIVDVIDLATVASDFKATVYY